MLVERNRRHEGRESGYSLVWCEVGKDWVLLSLGLWVSSVLCIVVYHVKQNIPEKAIGSQSHNRNDYPKVIAVYSRMPDIVPSFVVGV